jgi:D-beta-D-heptose 7-phosphate kinase/D-beta-D-heptose 1-phosphate adenosyltransferase
VELAGVVGKDIEARTLKRELKLKNVRCGGLVAESDRATTLKRRIIADSQQVVRMDREAAGKIAVKTLGRLLDYCGKMISNVDGIIISDYGKGVVTRKLVQELRRLKGKRNLPVAVDPKTSRFDIYRWVTVITPNRSEVEQNQHFAIDTDKMLLKAGRRLVKSLACSAVLITRGEEGMSLFERNGAVTHIPTVAREVYDVTGAGDTVTGVLTLSLACGASMREAAVISNYAAGVVVGKRGTAVLNREELMRMIQV